MKKLICLVFVVNVAWTAFSFDEGFTLGLRGDFFGALTMPDISEATLKYMNPKAVGMQGTLSSLLMGAELEFGYIFKTSDVFTSFAEDAAFSGIGVYAYLGMGQGNTSQKITAVENGESFDIFMIVDFLPVINFGIKGKALFFDNRFSLGLGVGGKAILDTSPGFLVYSSNGLIPTEIGEIIVTEEMMKKMNPLALSLRFEMNYAVPLTDADFVIGWFTAYNFYSPKYLTMPPSLLEIAQANRPGGENSPLLDFGQEFPDYWINSLEFGVNIGFVFKL